MSVRWVVGSSIEGRSFYPILGSDVLPVGRWPSGRAATASRWDEREWNPGWVFADTR